MLLCAVGCDEIVFVSEGNVVFQSQNSTMPNECDNSILRCAASPKGAGQSKNALFPTQLVGIKLR